MLTSNFILLPDTEPAGGRHLLEDLLDRFGLSSLSNGLQPAYSR